MNSMKSVTITMIDGVCFIEVAFARAGDTGRVPRRESSEREIEVAFAACDSPRSVHGLYGLFFLFIFFLKGEKRKRNTIRKTISQKHIKSHGGRSKTDVLLAAGEPNNIIFRARREAGESKA